MNNRQSGMTLLEVLAAIAVGTILFIGLTDMIDVSLEDAKGQQAAYHQSQISGAAKNYIAANYSSLMTATASGGVVAVTVPDLKTGGFLPSGFIDQNSYRQNTCMLVRQDSGKLNALVTTYNGTAIPDRSIVSVAMNAGQGSGYINSTDTANARGSSWSADTTPYRSGTCLSGANPLTGGASDAGHLVSNIFYDGPGQLSTDFIYRDAVPGRPELNRMNVPLQMANTGLVNLGDACAQTALAIENTTKDVVVCDGGKWRYTTSSWKEPVSNYTALASVSAVDGDVRITRDTGRAFVFSGGTGTWNALAVDQNGDLSVPRDLATARDITAGGTLHTAGHIYTDSDINVAQNAIVWGTLQAKSDVNIARNLDVGQTLTAWGYINAKNNMDISGYFRGAGEVRGNWMASNMIVLDGRAYAGAPCHQIIGNVIYNPHGTLMMDSNAILLNCTMESVFRYANGTNTP